MTQLETEVRDALVELERAVASMATANPKPNLAPLFSHLDGLTQQLPPGTDPVLLHYLHKKSYQKARLFLDGRDRDNAAGNCHGHVDSEGRVWSGENTQPHAGDESLGPR